MPAQGSQPIPRSARPVSPNSSIRRDRRYRYPFINCTQCGPRFTITRALPYDRARTSMAHFALCPPCRDEFENPAERRFHAQPNACSVCGRRLRCWAATGNRCRKATSSRPHWRGCSAARILAVEGPGRSSIWSATRATAAAVAALRSRKAREKSPLADLVAGPHRCLAWPSLGMSSGRCSSARERPVLLLRKRRRLDSALPASHRESPWLGAMLPIRPSSTCCSRGRGRPPGDRPGSGSRSPGAGDDQRQSGRVNARSRQHRGPAAPGAAPPMLLSSRPRLSRPLRRQPSRGPAGAACIHPPGRGYTPAPIQASGARAVVLAAGRVSQKHGVRSPGDEAFPVAACRRPDNAATCRALEETAAHLLDVLEIAPDAVSVRLHPDSTAPGLPGVRCGARHSGNRHPASPCAHWLQSAGEHGIRDRCWSRAGRRGTGD